MQRPITRLPGSVRYDWREGVVGLVLVGSVLAVGSVHVVAAIVVALASGVVASLVLADREFPRLAVLPCLTALALGLFTLLQAVPLPPGLVAALAPNAADVWTRALPTGGELGWISFSLDPGASLVEAAKWSGYAAIAAAAAVLARERGLTLLLAIVFGAGLCCALLAMAHLVLDASRLYGIYEPKLAVTPWRVAPLLNPNNLAGYLNFAAFAGFGVLLGRRSLVQPVLLSLALAFVLAVSILTGSRGGMVSLAVALLLLVWAVGRSDMARSSALASRMRRYFPVVLVVAGALGLALLGASAATWKALSEESLSKLSVNVWAVPMVLDHPWFGIGRGAFETVFPAYRQGGGRYLFQYPENFVTQWLSEWGLLVGGAALASFVWTLRPRRLRLADGLDRRCAHIALISLAVHNLVDLSLEVSSVATSAFAIVGALAGAADRQRGIDGMSVSHRAATWIPATVTGALAALALVFGRQSALTDRMELHATYEATDFAQAGARNQFLGHVTAAIRRHPGEPYLPFLAALALARTGKDPLPWLNRAIERDPQQAMPYYFLAQALFTRNVLDQALLHTRLAVERQPELGSGLAPLVVNHTTRLADSLRAVPAGTAGQQFLMTLARVAHKKGRGEITRQALLEEAIRRDPKAPHPRLLEATILLEAVEAKEPTECLGAERARCLDRVAKNLQGLDESGAFVLESTQLRARHLTAIGRAHEADDWLRRRCSELQAPSTCWRARVDAAIASGESPRIDAAIAAYLGMACVGGTDCAKLTLGMGDLLATKGDWLGAMNYYGKSARQHPSRAAWARFSKAARQAGQLERAREAERRADDKNVEVD